LGIILTSFILPFTEPKKKEERHQHFSSIDITLRSDSLDLNRRWQLKAGVYPKQDNNVRDGGFPTNSSLAGPFPSLYCCRPLHIRRHVSSVKAGGPKWGVILFSYL
jgi:hypothetical protein